MAKSKFLFLIILLPLSLQAQVYRCDTPQGTIYSQMPCEENAERLIQFDPVVNDTEIGLDGEIDASSEAPEPTPTAMESFILTLESQQAQQISAIDIKISQLQGQLSAEGEQAPEETARAAIESELATLLSDRISIADQYAALITEAASRTDTGDSIN